MSSQVACTTAADTKPESDGSFFGPTRSAALRRTLILFLFPSLVLVGTLRYDFVFDDTLVILKDPMVIGTAGLRSIFNQQVQVIDVTLGYYRPVISLLYWLDWSLWGENPAGYHLTNLLWHLVATLLVYRIALHTTGRILGAWAAAMIFAALPAHTEAIGWIQGRVDLVPTALGLLAYLCWFRAKNVRGLPAWSWGALSGGAYLAALLAKELALALLLAWAVWEISTLADLSPNERRDYVRSLVPCVCPFVLAVSAYGFLRSQAVHTLVSFPIRLFPPGVRLAGLLSILAEYGRVLLMPDLTLNFFRPLTVAPSPFTLAISLAVVLTFVGGLIVAWRRDKTLFHWIAWIPITLSPAMLFAFYGPASERGFYTAERFLYLPSVGWCILLGALVASACDAMHRPEASRFARIVLGGLLVGYAGLTLVRLQPWADPVDFYLAMQAQPNLPREMQIFVHNDLGRVYLERGEFQTAGDEFSRALRLKPDYALAHNNMGVLLIREGKPVDARHWLETATRLDPTLSDAYGNLGAAYEATGDLLAARQTYERGLQISPGSVFLERGLARVSAAAASPRVPQGAAPR
jgi:protein O-mannosyl-transferase